MDGDKSLNTVYLTVGIVAAFVAIFMGINEFINPNEDTHIEDSNGTFFVGDNNSYNKNYETNNYKTIINKITSYFDSPEKKDENAASTISNEDSIYTENGVDIYSENSADDKRSEISVPVEDRFVYDSDFSLVGKVVEKRNAFGGSYYELEDGISRVDIPDDEGKYYHIDVTTDDPESEVVLSPYFICTYEYKKDKFSDFTIATQEFGGDRIIGLGSADKMEDINETIYVRPISESYCWNFLEVIDPGLEPNVIDRNNLSIQLSIPSHISEGKMGGDIVTSNGHIKIVEIDNEEAGYYYHSIG